jgi:chemotaxis protein CheC
MDELGKFEINAVQEIINIGVGRAAHILNQMLGAKIKLVVPEVHYFEHEEELKNFEKFHEIQSTVTMDFTGAFSGTSALTFPQKSAARLVEILVPDSPSEGEDLNAITESTLNEVGNIILNSVVGSFSNMFEKTVEYNVPNYGLLPICDLPDRVHLEDEPAIIIADATFSVEGEDISGKVIMLFMIQSFKTLLTDIKVAVGS